MLNSRAELDLYQERFSSFYSGGFPGADPLIKPILEQISCIGELIPVWSCEGHPDNDIWDVFYIMFVCSEKGFKKLHNIHQRIVSKLMLLPLPEDEEFQPSAFVRSVRLICTTRTSVINDKPVPVVILNAGVPRKYGAQKDILLKTILDSVTEEATACWGMTDYDPAELLKLESDYNHL